MSYTEFRIATPQDTTLILDFIKGLAEYEKMSDQVIANKELLKEWIFEKKKAELEELKTSGRDMIAERIKEAGFDRSIEESCLHRSRDCLRVTYSLAVFFCRHDDRSREVVTCVSDGVDV